MTFTRETLGRQAVVRPQTQRRDTVASSRPGPVSRPLLNRRRVRGLALHLVLIIVATIYLLPMIYMVLRALMPWEVSGAALRQDRLTFDNFRELNAEIDLQRLLLNTTIVTAVRVVAQVTLSVTSGFAIARLRFAGRRWAFVTLVSCLMAPFPLLLIPLVVMVRVAGIYNSFAGLIAPTLVSGLGVLLFVQVFASLPSDLLDAGRVDGCGPWRLLWHIGCPYARSAIGAFGLLVTIYSWNEFLWASVATVGPKREMLTVGVAKLANQYGWTDPGVQMAAACVATIPIIAIAVSLRKYTRLSQHHLSVTPRSAAYRSAASHSAASHSAGRDGAAPRSAAPRLAGLPPTARLNDGQ